MPGADCNCDHDQKTWKETKRSMRNIKLDMDLFKSREELKDTHRVVVAINKNNVLANIQSTKEKWEMLWESIHLTGKEIIPERNETAKQKRMTLKQLYLMDKKMKL